MDTLAKGCGILAKGEMYMDRDVLCAGWSLPAHQRLNKLIWPTAILKKSCWRPGAFMDFDTVPRHSN